MADKPKVSSITVKVLGPQPDSDTSLESKVNVIIELQNDSVLIDQNDEFVLYLYPESDHATTLEYPQGARQRLVHGTLEKNTTRTFLFESRYPFLPANQNNEYPYSFQKITYNVFPSINPNSQWRVLDFPDSEDNFQIIPPTT